MLDMQTTTQRRKPRATKDQYKEPRINLNVSLGDLKIIEALLPEKQPIKHRLKATILRAEQKEAQR
jgi:hypothetical protein